MHAGSPDPAPAPKLNRLGLPIAEYRGGKTTLCAGCGHNAISERILEAYYDLGIPPERVAKLSGIGCSSKTPAYFMGRSHAFNGVHGRMPSLATGAVLANRTLHAIGVSGDGDTASIGVGQFVHLVRRNLPLVYVVENNGVYGLTKGQLSATADPGSVLKGGEVAELPAVDVCALAIQLGAAYVARSFSGDRKQLAVLLRGAIAHGGTAVLDVISPCVTFNDHEGSTRSFDWVKAHDAPLQDLTFLPAAEEVEVEQAPGGTVEVKLHDGSRLRLHALEADYDPRDRTAALSRLMRAQRGGEVLTGLLFVDPAAPTLVDRLALPPEPLATLPAERVRPPPAVLEAINAALR